MIFDTIKSYARSQIPGFAAGAGIVLAVAITLFVISRHEAGKDIPKPYISPISGAPAKVAEPRRDGDAILFPLEYDGAGSSTLNVPVDSVPEARAWRHYTWSTTALYLSDGTVGILKGYRYERVQIAAGPWIRVPRLQTLHFRQRASPDAGIAISLTYYSESPLF